MTSPTLANLLPVLSIPQEFSRFDKITDEQILAQLIQWKNHVCVSLSSLRDLLAVRHGITSLPLDEQADIAACVSAFDGPGEWVADDVPSLARSILDPLIAPHIPPVVLTRILTYHLKPIFAANPHPRLNLQTGRKLHEPAHTQDVYEGQVWKSHVGIANTLGWCLRNIDANTYESVWHLLLPPAMTFLDDFEASYKLQGVRLVSDLLSRVPPELLNRTGVDGLLFTSLSGAFNHLRDPLTPDLIRVAVPATLQLIDLTSPASLPPTSATPSPHRTIIKSSSPRADPATRYERLSTLLGTCLIGTVFLYAYADPEAILAATDMLPPVLTHLGIGAARWLKALIPQLTHALIPPAVAYLTPPRHIDLKLKVSSLRAICACIAICAPRMYLWKCNIVDAVGRAWVGALDINLKGQASPAQPADETGTSDLVHEYKALLQSTCVKLAEAWPSVIQEEYHQLLGFDSPLFGGLVGGICSATSDI